MTFAFPAKTTSTHDFWQNNMRVRPTDGAIFCFGERADPNNTSQAFFITSLDGFSQRHLVASGGARWTLAQGFFDQQGNMYVTWRWFNQLGFTKLDKNFNTVIPVYQVPASVVPGAEQLLQGSLAFHPNGKIYAGVATWNSRTQWGVAIIESADGQNWKLCRELVTGLAHPQNPRPTTKISKAGKVVVGYFAARNCKYYIAEYKPDTGACTIANLMGGIELDVNCEYTYNIANDDVIHAYTNFQEDGTQNTIKRKLVKDGQVLSTIVINSTPLPRSHGYEAITLPDGRMMFATNRDNLGVQVYEQQADNSYALYTAIPLPDSENANIDCAGGVLAVASFLRDDTGIHHYVTSVQVAAPTPPPPTPEPEPTPEPTPTPDPVSAEEKEQARKYRVLKEAVQIIFSWIK